MLEFQLFRIKVYPSNQLNIFEGDKSRPEILKNAIYQKPSTEFRKSLIWHIGNIQELDNTSIYFRLGRTSKSTIEVYKEGNFIDQPFETAPYTHIFLDIYLELCAIAKKSKLSPKAKGISSQFIRLLNKIQTQEATFQIEQINDPKDFIGYLEEAYSISNFWVTFSRPNIFDTDNDFIKPFQRFLSESDGEKGKAEIKGKNLNTDILKNIARSAASTGDDAAAQLQKEHDVTKVTKHLHGNPVIIYQENVDENSEKQDLIQKIRNLYHHIRGDN